MFRPKRIEDVEITFTLMRVGMAIILIAGFLLLSGTALKAQQFVTDDAAAIPNRGMQMEVWHGTRESWIQPIIRPIEWVELATAIGFTDDGTGSRDTHLLLEAKSIWRDVEYNRVGYGLVTGVGVSPFEELYAFVPVSYQLVPGRLVVHQNLGWLLSREPHGTGPGRHYHDHHHFIWGFKANLHLIDRFTFVGEIFGEDIYTPDFHVGVRAEVFPDVMEMDISYGSSFANGLDGLGFTVGVVVTPNVNF